MLIPSDFQRVFKQGRKQRGALFTLFSCTNGKLNARLGLAIAKKHVPLADDSRKFSLPPRSIKRERYCCANATQIPGTQQYIDARGFKPAMAILNEIFARFILGGIHFYRWILSPLLGNRCRFYPSCSQYALDAIEKHGAGYGCFLTVKRLSKCHPWHQGGLDQVP